MNVSYYITAVRLGPVKSEEHIELCSVLLPGTGTTYTFAPPSIVGLIDKGHVFAVGSPKGLVAVEAVRPAGKEPYIRTVANGLRTDNLIKLPRF